MTLRTSRCAAIAVLALFGLTAAGAQEAGAAAKRRTVPGELRRMLAAGAIDQAQHDARRNTWDDARATARRLPGARRLELGAVVRTVDDIAARGALTVSRLAPLFLTLERNREWWSDKPLLATGQRVSFPGSELVWQKYPGQGIQLQPLASFGKLNGLWSGGRRYDDRIAALLDELLPLAADRGDGLAWEYYFSYDGGRARPPWVSGLAQGTAVQALARAAIRLRRQDEVFAVARRALRIFELRPPTGVRVPIGTGAHYLIYSYDPALRVLNGFAQSLVGLYDFAALANDDRARGLFADGDRVARREVPAFDTGAWSLYSLGPRSRESDLGYHNLVRGFLAGLCKRTKEAVYCDAEARFGAYLTQKPVLALVTRRLRGGRVGSLRFRLSKISSVSAVVSRAGKVVLSRGGVLTGRGTRAIAWSVPRRRGDYTVRVTAVDLAGNAQTVEGDVEVIRPRT